MTHEPHCPAPRAAAKSEGAVCLCRNKPTFNIGDKVEYKTERYSHALGGFEINVVSGIVAELHHGVFGKPRIRVVDFTKEIKDLEAGYWVYEEDARLAQ